MMKEAIQVLRELPEERQETIARAILDFATHDDVGLAATSVVVLREGAAAQPYGATQGKEIAPGVRVADLGKRDSMVPSYKAVSMRDVAYQPKAKSPNPSMGNDMVCHCAEGELRIKQGPGMEFAVKNGDVWSCRKGLMRY